MSSSIDTRIVEMKFDNTQFEQGVRQTLSSLDALNKGLKLEGAAKGLQDVSAASKGFTLQHIADGVDSIKSKFSAMSVVAITALSNITNKAIAAGTNIAKSLTVAPIKQGLEEYETNLNAIQTILANTQSAGTGLKDVNKALQELNTYSDQTIYNFSEMARNIGTFTAAGVDLKTATGSIKGIANLAALSGSNSQQASTAMYQLSQAISAGRVSLQDWNSVVNAGMGGTVFQRALAQTAQKMGTLDKGAVKLTGKMKNATINGQSFRESITAKPGEKSWLTSEVLTKTLEQFTGDLTDAQLKAQGFSAEQIKAIQAQAKTAKNAATQVKTLSQLYGTLQEAAGSGWSQTWQLIFGDFEEAKKLWTGVNNVLGGFIQSSSDARNKIIGDWKALGGRTVLIAGIGSAFKSLLSIIKPIKEAFRLIFPAATGKQLYDITLAFARFAKSLQIGSDTAQKIRHTFAGVFAIFGIGWEIIKQVARVFAELFSSAGDGAGSFLDITAKIGDFLVALHMAIKNGDGLTKIFDKIIAVLKVPIKLLSTLAGYFASLFAGFDAAGAIGKLDALHGKLTPFQALGNAIKAVWAKTLSIIDDVAKAFAPMAKRFSEFFGGFGKSVSDGVSDIDFGKILDLINTGLFAGLLLLLKKFLGTADEAVDTVKKWRDVFTGPFDALTGTLGEMQKTLKAATLLQIAAAVALLAASAVALSKIDAAGLARAMGAMATLFIQLAAAMAVFQKIKIEKGMGQLILMALALRVLTSSVKALAELSWEDLAKGLSGTAALLAVLTAAAQGMPDGKKMISSSLGLAIMAGAIKILVSAVTDLSGLSWEDMARGLTGVGTLLGSLALFTRLAAANKGGISSGAGLVLLAVGVKILAGAMEDFAGFSWDEIGRGLAAMGGGLALVSAALMLIPPSSILSAAAIFVVASSLSLIGDAVAQMGGFEWETIGKGLATMAGALTLISLALGLLPPTSLLSAAAIFVVASSLGMISDALGQMGGMSWEEIAKGLVTLAGALTIISVAMATMTTAIFGATALIVVAGALAILAPILLLFGNMSWEEIGKGLVMLAGAFAVIGIAGALLTPVIPTLLGLGIAIALLGVGIAAAGVGVLAFSVALTALAAAGAAGTAAIVGIVAGLIGLIPTVMEAIGKGLIAFAQVIATAGPAITLAITTVLMALLNAIIRLTPKIIQTLLVMLAGLLAALVRAIPMMVTAGMKLITGILNGIAANVGKMVTAATNVIVNFLNGISQNLPRIIDAGVKLIISFVNGVANAIRSNTAQLNAAGLNLADAIVDGMTGGIRAGVGRVVEAAKGMASSALNAAKNLLGIHSPSREFAKLGKFSGEGYAKGLQGTSKQIAAAHSTLRSELSKTMKAAAKDIQDAKKKLSTLTHARHKDTKAIAAQKKALAQAQSEYRKASAGLKMVNTWGDETKRLQTYANQLDTIGKKLDAAKKQLADATKARDDFAKSTTDQFNNLPDIQEDEKLTDYITDLQKKVADTQIFTSQLQKLKDLGLNDAMYRELLAKGTDAIPFVTQILDGGKNSVDELNTLGSALQKSATDLGNTASKALYQAAVDSAAGLVKGLEAQQKNIEKVMDKLADAMVKAIKKKLGIKSPSREFMKVGDWSVKGLAAGLEDSGAAVKAAESVGHNAIDAMRKTLTGLSDVMVKDVDTNPTIRPVLDLTDVKKEAGRLGGMLSTQPLEVGPSYSQAQGTSLALKERRQADYEAADANNKPGDRITFNQYNSSPKALSEAEIYRKTNNQLSVAKGALTKKR